MHQSHKFLLHEFQEPDVFNLIDGYQWLFMVGLSLNNNTQLLQDRNQSFHQIEIPGS
jgi:hypothetical protein